MISEIIFEAIQVILSSIKDYKKYTCMQLYASSVHFHVAKSDNKYWNKSNLIKGLISICDLPKSALIIQNP